MIVEETTRYFESWGESGTKDALKAFAELTIMTASRCLLGKEIRNLLDESGEVGSPFYTENFSVVD